MTHAEFISKLGRYKAMWEQYQKDKSYSGVAKTFGLFGAMQAANAILFYQLHKDDKQYPQFGNLRHITVKEAALCLPLNDVVLLRKKLISTYGATFVGHKHYPGSVPRRILRAVLKYSGLEWFEKDNKPLVHWKHDAEIA